MHKLSVLQFLLPVVLAAAQATPPVVERDLVYGQAGGVDLKLDFVRPGGDAGPFPLVLCIHGGGWQSGSKSGHLMVLHLLAQNGYAAASVDYRLAPANPFPAQLQDVRMAARYLRDHAVDLKLDATRIATFGDSAGGHLALMLGLSDPKDGIRAVVNFYGPTDLQRWQAGPEGEAALGMTSDKLLENVFGTSDRKSAVLRNASPVYNIGKAKPAVFTMHGDADPVVKSEQAVWLHEALGKAGFEEKLVVVKGASHGFQGPDLENAVKLVLEFLNTRLKPAAVSMR